MNSYKTSSGERIPKSEIDRRVRLAKSEKLSDQINDFGFNYCEQCAIEGQPENANDLEFKILDCAHIESVDSCQKNGRTEKASDKNNLTILCRFHHRKKDRLNLKFNK